MAYKQICPHCKEEIPPEWVQQGGLHMGCHEEKINTWFVSLPYDPENGFYENEPDQVLEVIKNMEEPYLISKVKMTAGMFHNLPEFKGF